MKANDFRDMTMEELEKRIQALKENLFSHRFKMVTGQLENTNVVQQTKRDIARALTVQKEHGMKEQANA